MLCYMCAARLILLNVNQIVFLITIKILTPVCKMWLVATPLTPLPML